jgi:hypothetical protein
MKKLGAISDNKINLGAILVICRILNRRLRMRAVALTYSWPTSIADVLEYNSSSFANDTGLGLVCLFVWPFETLPNAGMRSINQPAVQRLQ